MRFRNVIVTSFAMGWLVLTGCQTTSPYLRDLKPAYDESGKLDPESYRINKAWMKHMLKDLDACYKDSDQ